MILTFDDGPSLEHSVKILTLLNKNSIKATFFWITRNAEKLNSNHNREFYKILDLVDYGNHIVGYHGPRDYTPSIKTRLTSSCSREDFIKGHKDLEVLTKRTIRLYRPHYALQPFSIIWSRQLGMKLTLGDTKIYVSPQERPEIQIEKLRLAKTNSVLVLHEGTTKRRSSTNVLEVLDYIVTNMDVLD